MEELIVEVAGNYTLNLLSSLRSKLLIKKMKQ